jgi:hypothetical protein
MRRWDDGDVSSAQRGHPSCKSSPPLTADEIRSSSQVTRQFKSSLTSSKESARFRVFFSCNEWCPTVYCNLQLTAFA